MGKILDGRLVSEELNKITKKKVENLLASGVTPTLAIMRADQNPASIQYEKSATRFMEKVGIETKHVSFPDGVSQEDFLQALDELNQSADVHGILVMQPLPDNIALNVVAEHISPVKDIDGMHALNLGKIMAGDSEAHLPSTVRAVIELIEYYKIGVARKEITVIGKSTTVGKPLSVLLLNQGATVTTCHTATADLKKYTKNADILITATGEIGLITKEHVTPDTVVIDVGFNFEEGKAYGDVAYEEVASIVTKITPVPGGVGSVTTASLARQVADATEWLQKK
jgi:methylenetetrahydrofolate dehydrogenase (NADP+)/methenyltetrahydrofolate cyclohydrolase